MVNRNDKVGLVKEEKREMGIKTGWYFRVGGKEFFVETERKNKTRVFAEKILEKIGVVKTEENVNYILRSMLKANLEVCHCPANAMFGVKAHDYYNIYGRGFGGFGSEDVDDGNTILLKID